MALLAHGLTATGKMVALRVDAAGRLVTMSGARVLVYFAAGGDLALAIAQASSDGAHVVDVGTSAAPYQVTLSVPLRAVQATVAAALSSGSGGVQVDVASNTYAGNAGGAGGFYAVANGELGDATITWTGGTLTAGWVILTLLTP